MKKTPKNPTTSAVNSAVLELFHELRILQVNIEDVILGIGLSVNRVRDYDKNRVIDHCKEMTEKCGELLEIMGLFKESLNLENIISTN